MNLHNLSDKEFDAEIKRQVAGSNIPFDPSAWKKMNQKLDGVFPNAGSNGRGSYELIAVVLLLSSFFFWSVGNFISYSKEAPELEIEGGSRNNNIVDPDQEHLVDAAVESNNTGIDKEETSDPAGSSVDLNTQRPKSQPPARSQDITSTDNLIKAKESRPANQNTHLADERASASKTGSGTGERGILVRGDLAAARAFQGPHYRWMQVALPESVAAMTLKDAEPPPVIKTRTSHWALGLGYAPDLSLVGFSEFTKPGRNLALSASYRLSARWSIQSGITLAKKNYKALGRDYHPPLGFWNYGVVPDVTDATCEVIDIPLNIRYYFHPGAKNRFYASTGVSTYVMLTEDYQYRYEHNYPGLLPSWKVRNENQHVFGIVNFSLGFEKSIAPQWYVEMEPFIKAPISGIGFGKVDLWSTGTMFSIKFKFP